MVNKREFTRVNCRLDVAMISNGHFFRDIIVDLSEDGAQIEFNPAVSIGPDVMLKAYIGSKMVKAIGDIKWKDNKRRRAGVQFLYLPRPIRRYIREVAKKSRLDV